MSPPFAVFARSCADNNVKRQVAKKLLHTPRPEEFEAGVGNSPSCSVQSIMFVFPPYRGRLVVGVPVLNMAEKRLKVHVMSMQSDVSTLRL